MGITIREIFVNAATQAAERRDALQYAWKTFDAIHAGDGGHDEHDEDGERRCAWCGAYSGHAKDCLPTNLNHYDGVARYALIRAMGQRPVLRHRAYHRYPQWEAYVSPEMQAVLDEIPF